MNEHLLQLAKAHQIEPLQQAISEIDDFNINAFFDENFMFWSVEDLDFLGSILVSHKTGTATAPLRSTNTRYSGKKGANKITSSPASVSAEREMVKDAAAPTVR